MGIPSYFKYIITNYEKIFKKKHQLKNIDDLYIDSNSIIYDSLRKLDNSLYDNNADFENDLYNKFIEIITQYIEIIKPSRRVYIAIDGVVPYAKIEQQRERRYKSVLLSEYTNELKNNKSFKWDKTAITPGTRFMNQLDRTVERYTKTIQDRFNIEVIFSGSNIPGEGEHKLFDFIRNYCNNMDSITVYGLDADLIMLSLTNIHYTKNIHLVRECPEYSTELENIYETEELMFMDIYELMKVIINRMCNSTNINKINSTNKIHDYIFISFLLGNDFMPHFPALNIRDTGIDILFNYYHKCFNSTQSIINNGKIIWKNFKKFIEILKKEEQNNLIENTDKLISYEKIAIKKYSNTKEIITEEDIENELFKYSIQPSLDRTTERYINPKHKGWIERYYDSLFYCKYKEDIIKDISINYLEGLEWCYKYYTTGCIDTKWKYKYNYPPLINDLYRFIPIFDTTFFNSTNSCNSYVHPISLLSYVLPLSSHDLLPSKLSNIIKEKYDYILNNSFDIETSYCKYMWEGHVDFPYIDTEEYMNFVENNIDK